MDEFATKLAEMLRGLGTSVEYYGGRYINIAECDFEMEYKYRTGNVKFLGKMFKRPYDVGKAVVLVVQALPERLKALKLQKDREAKIRQVRDIQRAIGVNCNERVAITSNGEEFILRFQYADVATVLAASDMLNEAGFFDETCTQAKPNVEQWTDAKILSHLREMVDLLSEERKLKLRDLLSE